MELNPATEPEKVVESLNQELDEVLDDTQDTVLVPIEAKDIRRQPQQPVYAGEPGSVERMMEIALHNGGAQVLEILERLTALKNAQEDRRAEKDFAEHFAKMQSEFVAIKKEKEGYNYKYAPLGKLIEHFGPAIADNGFSHWFEGVMLEKPEGWKRITLHIAGWGHERTNHFDVPPVERPTSSSGKISMNVVQALASADTYGERYDFIAGYGLPILDEEDDDAQSFTTEEVLEQTPALSEIEKAQTSDVLKKAFAKHYKAAENDSVRMLLMAAKDRQKAVLKEIADAAIDA